MNGRAWCSSGGTSTRQTPSRSLRPSSRPSSQEPGRAARAKGPPHGRRAKGARLAPTIRLTVVFGPTEALARGASTLRAVAGGRGAPPRAEGPSACIAEVASVPAILGRAMAEATSASRAAIAPSVRPAPEAGGEPSTSLAFSPASAPGGRRSAPLLGVEGLEVGQGSAS